MRWVSGRWVPAALALMAGLALCLGCGLFESDTETTPETPLFRFTIGPGGVCGPEVIVRTDSLYGCPYELVAQAVIVDASLATAIEGVRRADRYCPFCRPAFDRMEHLSWSTCFTPPGDELRLSFTHAGQTDLFDATFRPDTVEVRSVRERPHFIQYAPWSEWEASQ